MIYRCRRMEIRARYLRSSEARIQGSFHSSNTLRDFGVRFRGSAVDITAYSIIRIRLRGVGLRISRAGSLCNHDVFCSAGRRLSISLSDIYFLFAFLFERFVHCVFLFGFC